MIPFWIRHVEQMFMDIYNCLVSGRELLMLHLQLHVGYNLHIMSLVNNCLFNSYAFRFQNASIWPSSTAYSGPQQNSSLGRIQIQSPDLELERVVAAIVTGAVEIQTTTDTVIEVHFDLQETIGVVPQGASQHGAVGGNDAGATTACQPVLRNLGRRTACSLMRCPAIYVLVGRIGRGLLGSCRSGKADLVSPLGDCDACLARKWSHRSRLRGV